MGLLYSRTCRPVVQLSPDCLEHPLSVSEELQAFSLD